MLINFIFNLSSLPFIFYKCLIKNNTLISGFIIIFVDSEKKEAAKISKRNLKHLEKGKLDKISINCCKQVKENN